MQIVVNIDDNLYTRLFDNGKVDAVDMLKVCTLVRKGKILPKGHGDIVDIETLIDMFWDGNSMEITKYDLSVIEPTIEADKSESEAQDADSN